MCFTFNRRQIDRIFSGVFDGGPHRVLEQLEHDVVQVRGDVHELDRVLPAVLLRAHVADLKGVDVTSQLYIYDIKIRVKKYLNIIPWQY